MLAHGSFLDDLLPVLVAAAFAWTAVRRAGEDLPGDGACPYCGGLAREGGRCARCGFRRSG